MTTKSYHPYQYLLPKLKIGKQIMQMQITHNYAKYMNESMYEE